MPWNAITDGMVLEEFTPQEQAALKGIQAQDALPKIIGRVVSNIRGKIAAGGGDLGEEGTVPDTLLTEAIDIARWRWLVSFPQMKAMQTDARKSAYDAAMKMLEQVAKGDITVESPTSGESTVPVPSFGTKRRKFSECDEDGA